MHKLYSINYNLYIRTVRGLEEVATVMALAYPMRRWPECCKSS